MNTESKLEIFGDVSSAITLLERAQKQLENLWAMGYIRLTPDDIETMTKMLSHIRKTGKGIGEGVERFNAIAVKVETINQLA